MVYQIKYSEVVKFKNLGFEDYLEIPGQSHSGLKQMKDGIKKDFIVTDKVRVGKIVDQILCDGTADISNPLYPAAKDIAANMKAELGSLLNLLVPQVSYGGTMEYEGIKMLIKGRLDEMLGKVAVVDFKVNNSKGIKRKDDLIPLITHMGYDNQLYNYGRFESIPNHFLFIYNTFAKKTFFFKRLQSQLDVDLAENWWINKILEHGNI